MIPKNKRVKDPKAIKAATQESCEICGAPTGGIGPHHIVTRGAGGPDIPENLIQPCWDCHYVRMPAGKYSQVFLFDLVGQRLKKTGEECRIAVRRAMSYDV